MRKTKKIKWIETVHDCLAGCGRKLSIWFSEDNLLETVYLICDCGAIHYINGD